MTDADKKPVGEKSVDASDGKTVIEIENAHLWNGTQDPYLYSLTAELLKDGENRRNFGKVRLPQLFHRPAKGIYPQR